MTTNKPYTVSYPSNFINIEGHKIHYIEAGNGNPILFIHGNPTSSYLWRNVMPYIQQATGGRVIALDLLGFGMSDKHNIHYTLQLHSSVVERFIEKLELKNVTLIVHDWGGPLGVTYAINNSNNVKAIIALDTFLWNLTWADFPKKLKPVFKMMRSSLGGFLMIQVMNGFVKQFLPQNILNKENVQPELLEQYKKPFPTIASRKAIRAFPALIPVEKEPIDSFNYFENIERNISTLKQPILMLTAKPGMGEVDMGKIESLQRGMPNLEHMEFNPSGHYMQEDNPEGLSSLIVSWLSSKNISFQSKDGSI